MDSTETSLRDQRLNTADVLAKNLPEEIIPARVRELMRDVTPLQPVFIEEHASAATAIDKSDLDGFKEHGWKTFYQRGPTWHLDFGGTYDDAAHAREFNDYRLFGNRCLMEMTFAVLQHPFIGDPPDRIFKHLLHHGDSLPAGIL